MDPYAVLGVAPSATDAEIARAFRRLALLHHPDRNGGSATAAARFREIKAAYDALRRRVRAKDVPLVGRNARELDPERVSRVRERLPRLNGAIRAAIASPSSEALAHVIDLARWTRLDADTALALKGHVSDLRDARWARLRFTNAADALATFQAFADAPTKVLDLVEMRNLRARVEGVLTVARGYHEELVRTTAIFER